MTHHNFVKEHEFIAVAKRHMQGLRAAQDEGAVPIAHAQRLHEMYQAAESVSARAVMACVKQCISRADSGDLHHAFELRTLARLITQFETGLLEVDPGGAERPAYNLSNSPLSALTGKQIMEHSHVLSLKSEQSRCENSLERPSSAQVLGELIDFAPAQQRASLETLMRMSREGAGLDMANAPSHERETNTGIDLGAEVLQEPAKPVSLVTLESLMEAVTHRALSSAHHTYKHVSLSYACEGILIERANAQLLSDLLSSLCDLLVRQSVSLPAVREKIGLSGTSQIAVTASETTAGLTIDLFCDDQMLSQNALALPPVAQAIEAFQSIGGSVSLSLDRVSGVMLCVRYPMPSETSEPRGGRDRHKGALSLENVDLMSTLSIKASA